MLFQGPGRVLVPRTVRSNLCLPPFGICGRFDTVDYTAVPEATIYKDSNVAPRKSNVYGPPALAGDWECNSVSEPVSVKQTSNRQLRFGISPSQQAETDRRDRRG